MSENWVVPLEKREKGWHIADRKGQHINLLSSNSECTQSFRYIWDWTYLSDFRVPSYGSGSDFDFRWSKIRRTRPRVTPKSRNRSVTRLMELRKFRLDPESEVRSARALNHELDNQMTKLAPQSEIGTPCWSNQTDPIPTLCTEFWPQYPNSALS